MGNWKEARLSEPVEFIISRYKSKSLEEQRAYYDELALEIREYDSLPFEEQVNYDYRNNLVQIRRGLAKNLPYKFKVGEKAIWNHKRKIKVTVVEHLESEMKSLLIRPNDNILKSVVVITENQLTKITIE